MYIFFKLLNYLSPKIRIGNPPHAYELRGLGRLIIHKDMSDRDSNLQHQW
jgi:hypothetical protein